MTRVDLFAVDLEIDGPWAVGGLRGVDRNDVTPVVGDGLTPYLPASGLVGSLRSHLGSAAASVWLGPDMNDYAKSVDAAPAAPSPMRVLGAVLDRDLKIRSAQTTAIDGWSGAARAGALRTSQVVESARGRTRARWFLVLDRAAAQPVEDFVDTVRTWQPFVGGERTSGSGLARVTAVHHTYVDLAVDDDLTWWLGERHAWFATMHTRSAAPPIGPPGRKVVTSGPVVDPNGPRELMRLGWKLTSPLHVGSGEIAEPGPKEARRARSALVRRDAAGNVVVPGTAWKGVFRHRAQFILQILLDASVILDERIVADTITRLFGSTRRRGVLRFSSSVISEDRDKPSKPVETTHRAHVAIDRISGGARRNLLYAQENVRTGRITLVIEALDDVGDVEVALLRHVVRDLNDGLIGIGGSTRRGYGGIALVNLPRFTAQELDLSALSDQEAAQS